MINASNVVEVPLWLIGNLGRIALWLSAAGVIIFLWIVFQVINLIVNRKKRKALYTIRGDLQRVEKKIDKLLKNSNKKK